MELRSVGMRAFDFAFACVLAILAPALRVLAHRRRQLPLAIARATAAGIAIVPKHYHSPVVVAADLRHDLRKPRQLPGIKLDLATHQQFLVGLDFADELLAIPLAQPAQLEFGYDNDFFSAGDCEILYGIIRRDRPRRIVEIGSGNSTLIIRKALERNKHFAPDYQCTHVCIEPFEAAWLEDVGATVIRQRVECVDLTLFDTLEAGDILFVDSSHVIRPQGDVVHEIAEIYPRLRPGVLVHIHDIFTPRDYPRRWVIDEMKMWNEQYLLEGFLAFNPGYEIVCALNWLATDHREFLQAACPVLTGSMPKQPGSFWIRRTAG